MAERRLYPFARPGWPRGFGMSLRFLTTAAGAFGLLFTFRPGFAGASADIRESVNNGWESQIKYKDLTGFCQFGFKLSKLLSEGFD